jgi:hypothetical protein
VAATRQALFLATLRHERGLATYLDVLNVGDDRHLSRPLPLAPVSPASSRFARPPRRVNASAALGGGQLAPSSCARERVFSQWGTVCHHVELGVSRFIPSNLLARDRAAA